MSKFGGKQSIPTNHHLRLLKKILEFVKDKGINKIGTSKDRASDFLVIWDTTKLPSGNYHFKAVATDGDGNTDPDPPFICIVIDHDTPDYSGNIVKKDKDNTIKRGDEIKVSIPAGAIEEDTILHISKLDEDRIPPLKENSSGNLYLEIELESGQRELNKPVTVSIPYEDEDNDGIVDRTNIPEDTLRMYVWDGKKWEELQTTVDTIDNVVTGITTHFTIFGVFGKAIGKTLDDVYVYPNPLKPDSDTDVVTFNRLPSGASIRIYTILGELVSAMENITTGSMQWDTRNKHGKRVTSGVYLYVLTDDQGRIKRGKVVIIR